MENRQSVKNLILVCGVSWYFFSIALLCTQSEERRKSVDFSNSRSERAKAAGIYYFAAGLIIIIKNSSDNTTRRGPSCMREDKGRKEEAALPFIHEN